MVYAKEIKYQICKRIVEKEISVEKASLECGASIGTIKKWVNLYEKDPDNAFKKKDIEGGAEKELQGTQGLINVVREQFLLSEKQMSEEAYRRYVVKIGHELESSDIENDADTILKELLFLELEYYKECTDKLLTNALPYYRKNIYGTLDDCYPNTRKLIDKLDEIYYEVKDGKITREVFLEKVSSRMNPITHLISFSIYQSSKSRAGAAFENHLQKLLDICEIRNKSQQQEREGKTIIDFVVPSIEEAQRNPTHSASIECQTTLKDRFRLSSGKTITTDMNCFLATPTGVGIFTKKDNKDITVQKVSEIVYEDKMTLVVFPEVQERIKELLYKNIELLEKGTDIGKGFLGKKDICEILLNQIGTKIITFTQLFQRELPVINKYWEIS